MNKTSDKFTVGASWDGGNYYSVEYVNILYDAIKRNCTIPFDFVLHVGPLAEKNTARYRIKEPIKIVPTGLVSWWCGMPFWCKNPPGVETETLLYMDLDQVIVGNIDDIVNYPSDHCYMKDYPAELCPRGKERDGNATVSLIRNGAGYKVWEAYVDAGLPQWDPFKPPVNRKCPLAAQGLMNELYQDDHDVFPENWVASYKLSVLRHGMPLGCKSVSFHGKPKPHECTHLDWVKENWR